MSPGDMMQFESAKTVRTATFILNDWKVTGKYERGLKGVSLAYIFIVFYTMTVSIGCRFFSGLTGNEILSRGGRGFSILILIAAICDVIGKIAISRAMTGHVSQANISLSYNLARIKISFIIICLLFILVCLIYWLISKFGRTEKSKLL
jgi:hypothetical protein